MIFGVLGKILEMKGPSEISNEVPSDRNRPKQGSAGYRIMWRQDASSLLPDIPRGTLNTNSSNDYQIRHWYELRGGDHLCGLYHEDREQKKATLEFVMNGLRENNKILWVEDSQPIREEMLADLRAMEVRLEEILAKGQIILIHSSEILENGYFNPQKMLEQWVEYNRKALQEGFAALRVLGSPKWLMSRSNFDKENFLKYELMVNVITARNQIVAFCQFQIKGWDSLYLQDVLEVHPLALLGDEVFQNFYHIPPDLYFVENSNNSILERKMQNLVDRKRVEEKLVQAKENALAIASAKSKFMATVSHEIRTPLVSFPFVFFSSDQNGILGMTEELLQKPRAEEEQESLETIATSGNHLMKVINEVLESSRIESGKVSLENRPFDLNQCVLEAVAISRPHTPKHVTVVSSVRKGCPVWVEGDVTRVRQVVVNLMGNALKFTEEGKVELFVDYELKDNSEAVLHFSVKDTGIGIPAHRLDAIFTGFTQANQSTTRLYGGTGLGLSISKQLVELWGGRIWVDSKEGVGSTFSFTLPTKIFIASNAEEKREKLKSKSSFENLSILVAEDNPTNQKVMRRMLGRLGCKFLIVNNGKEAVDSVSRFHYDVILMDIFMPVMDGWEATRKIRDTHGTSSPKVIALTASMMVEEDKELNLLFDSYIMKPISTETLKSILEKVSNTLPILK